MAGSRHWRAVTLGCTLHVACAKPGPPGGVAPSVGDHETYSVAACVDARGGSAVITGTGSVALPSERVALAGMRLDLEEALRQYVVGVDLGASCANEAERGFVAWVEASDVVPAVTAIGDVLAAGDLGVAVTVRIATPQQLERVAQPRPATLPGVFDGYRVEACPLEEYGVLGVSRDGPTPRPVDQGGLGALHRRYETSLALVAVGVGFGTVCVDDRIGFTVYVADRAGIDVAAVAVVDLVRTEDLAVDFAISVVPTVAPL